MQAIRTHSYLLPPIGNVRHLLRTASSTNARQKLVALRYVTTTKSRIKQARKRQLVSKQLTAKPEAQISTRPVAKKVTVRQTAANPIKTSSDSNKR